MSVNAKPERFIGIDAHKYYLIAVGVDAERNPVYGPQRVSLVLQGEEQSTPRG